MKNSRDKFIAHGYYTITNTIGYSVEISEDGCSARLKVNDKITDWYDIEYFPSDEDDTDELHAYIDRYGYNVPLNLVIRSNQTFISYYINNCRLCNESFVGYGNNAAPIMDGICCNKCNYDKVIPARLEILEKQ